MQSHPLHLAQLLGNQSLTRPDMRCAGSPLRPGL